MLKSEEDIVEAMERLEFKRKEIENKFEKIKKPSKRVVEKTVQTIKEEKIDNGAGGLATLQQNLVITKSKLSKKYMIAVRGNVQIIQEKNLDYRPVETFQLCHSITFSEKDIDELIVKIIGGFTFGTSGSYDVSDGKVIELK